MNEKQARIVEALRSEVVRRDCRDNDELKEFDVREFPKFVVVTAVTGTKDDEGTAAMLTRYTRKIFVGRRGGLSYLRNGKRRTLPWHDTLPV